jgi:hypothetical protein
VEVPAKFVSILVAYGREDNPGALVVPAFSEDPLEPERGRITFADLTHDNINGTVNYYLSPPCENPEHCDADPANATLIWEESRFGERRTVDVPRQWRVLRTVVIAPTRASVAAVESRAMKAARPFPSAAVQLGGVPRCAEFSFVFS